MEGSLDLEGKHQNLIFSFFLNKNLFDLWSLEHKYIYDDIKCYKSVMCEVQVLQEDELHKKLR